MASSDLTTSKQNPELNSNTEMVKQDDETDSCFEFIKRRNLPVKSTAYPIIKSIELAPDELKPQEPETNTAPKVVVVKPITQFSSKVSPIKPVKSSPFKQSCIDKIAENLKALQEQKKTAIPKVTPVTAKPVANTDLGNKDALLDEKLRNIKLSPKEIAHQLILLRCKKIDNAKRIESNANRASLTSVENHKNQTKMDEYEMNDDLTNLNWLTTFNLCKTSGISHKYPLSLSPPATPSSPISPLSTYNNSSIEGDTTLEHDAIEDEADGNHPTSQSISRNSAVWPVISKLLKNWQQQTITTISPNRTPDQQKKENIPNAAVRITQMQATQQRPPFSYSCLTFLAIESSQRKRLSVKEIYNWVISHFPYYHSVPSGSWKNSIRHNLALNQSFCKVDKNLLAMRDFSGKGSLWCINPDRRPKLLEVLEKTRNNDLQSLLHLPYLQDISESVKPVSINTNPVQKLTKNRSASALSAAPMTIINPRLTQKLNFNAQTSPTQGKVTHQSLKSLSKPAPVVVSPAVLKTHRKPLQQPPTKSDLTELDAVNALLSMKSRASSMPSQTESDEGKASGAVEIKQGRRKQVFKPPVKKPHINPKLLEKCSSALFYNDIDDEDEEDIEDDFEDENDVEMNLSQESDFEADKSAGKKKLQIKFPNFTPKKSVVSNNNENNKQHCIVTMSDDESDDMDENKLEIDESFTEQKDQFDKEVSTQEETSEVLPVSNEDSNESNLEPGEVRKNIKPNSSLRDDSHLLLELSRAASIVEDDTTSAVPQKVDDLKKSEPNTLIEDLITTPSKAKRAKFTTEASTTTPARATRSSSGQGSAIKATIELPERTVTRSATKRKSK